jgi:hypothetical protein
MEAPKSVAVFLGPSLVHERATELLDASYYPPARMGDVYRLVASGVRLIVLVDGVFHGAAAVWQRELLEAMEQGIAVVGASSMGALRAAELHTLGMIGVGTIFEQYRDGVIDGDDEVALLHADADAGYRPLSQPLVGIRHRLETAVARGELTREQADALIEHAKRLSFTQRTHARLLACDVARGWPASTRERLRAVFDDPALDLKRRDAERALAYAAALVARGELRGSLVPRPAPSRFYRATSMRKRGLLHPAGHLVSGEALWEVVSAQRAVVRRCLDAAARQLYLASLAEHWEVQCPAGYVDDFRGRWDERHAVTDLEGWLRANGLTEGERRERLERRARVAWMIERGPIAFGVDSSSFSRLPALWAHHRERVGRGGGLPDGAAQVRAMERCLLATWARLRGITCPEPVVERLEARLGEADGRAVTGLDSQAWRALVTELACSQWIVRQQPYRFGHTGWSPITAVLEELQITGRAAHLVAEHPWSP